jgi:hypothetical protein
VYLVVELYVIVAADGTRGGFGGLLLRRRGSNWAEEVEVEVEEEWR